MNENLPIGTVVRLKSGGPMMTVTHRGKDPSANFTVNCLWFSDGKYHDQVFMVQILDVISEKINS